MEDSITITVSEETEMQLDRHREPDETFDDALRNLLDGGQTEGESGR